MVHINYGQYKPVNFHFDLTRFAAVGFRSAWLREGYLSAQRIGAP
jgi:hypothetical protein